jgi:hypothetical protein
MELKEKVLETIKNMCECGGLAAKPRIYAIARFLHADKADVINAVDELVAEGIVEYRSDVPSESHICIVLKRKKYKVSEKRAKMRKLAEEFYLILQRSEGCPFETYNKIIDKGYKDEDMRIMFRLLYRWVEWQKLSGFGGRIYYNYFKLLEEYT